MAMPASGTFRTSRDAERKPADAFQFIDSPLSHCLCRRPVAACSGLGSAPDCRTRRALLHLSYSCASPFGPATLVTHDPKRNSELKTLKRGIASTPALSNKRVQQDVGQFTSSHC